MQHVRRRVRRAQVTGGQRSRAQALTELALVMPVMVGLIAVLFQFGILFMSYLAVVHTTRDVGRWLAVNPETTDAEAVTYARANVPSALDPTRLTVTLSPSCTVKVNGRCTTPAPRPSGDPLVLQVTYNASSSLFLPTDFRIGPYFRVALGPTLSTYTYTYTVLMEPH